MREMLLIFYRYQSMQKRIYYSFVFLLIITYSVLSFGNGLDSNEQLPVGNLNRLINSVIVKPASSSWTSIKKLTESSIVKNEIFTIKMSEKKKLTSFIVSTIVGLSLAFNNNYQKTPVQQLANYGQSIAAGAGIMQGVVSLIQALGIMKVLGKSIFLGSTRAIVRNKIAASISGTILLSGVAGGSFFAAKLMAVDCDSADKYIKEDLSLSGIPAGIFSVFFRVVNYLMYMSTFLPPTIYLANFTGDPGMAFLILGLYTATAIASVHSFNEIKEVSLGALAPWAVFKQYPQSNATTESNEYINSNTTKVTEPAFSCGNATMYKGKCYGVADDYAEIKNVVNGQLSWLAANTLKGFGNIVQLLIFVFAVKGFKQYAEGRYDQLTTIQKVIYGIQIVSALFIHVPYKSNAYSESGTIWAQVFNYRQFNAAALTSLAVTLSWLTSLPQIVLDIFILCKKRKYLKGQNTNV